MIDDTLKRDKNGVRRFSATRLTMFSAWGLVCWSYIQDLMTYGYRHERLLLMVGVATGMKVTDAIGKKLDKTE